MQGCQGRVARYGRIADDHEVFRLGMTQLLRRYLGANKIVEAECLRGGHRTPLGRPSSCRNSGARGEGDQALSCSGHTLRVRSGIWRSARQSNAGYAHSTAHSIRWRCRPRCETCRQSSARAPTVAGKVVACRSKAKTVNTATFAKGLGKAVQSGEQRVIHQRRYLRRKVRGRQPSMLDPHVALISSARSRAAADDDRHPWPAQRTPSRPVRKAAAQHRAASSQGVAHDCCMPGFAAPHPFKVSDPGPSPAAELSAELSQ
jgi:hypothetical protein